MAQRFRGNQSLHGYHGASGTKDVHKNLNHRLVILRVDSMIEVLNAEEEADHVEESEDIRYREAHYNADRGIASSIVSLFTEMGGGVEPYKRD